MGHFAGHVTGKHMSAAEVEATIMDKGCSC